MGGWEKRRPDAEAVGGAKVFLDNDGEVNDDDEGLNECISTGNTVRGVVCVVR